MCENSKEDVEMIEWEEIEKSPNGYFERRIRWSKDALKKLGDGYLIQKIVRQTTTSKTFPALLNDPDSFNHMYYEAWKIVNGKPVYDDKLNNDFDDVWTYGPNKRNPFDSTLEDYSDKHRSTGKVTMEGKLFFVPAGHPYIQTIEQDFKKGQVPYAEMLLSCKKSDIEEKIDSNYQHSFTNGWDFSDDEKFFSAVLAKLEKSIELSKLTWEHDYSRYLKDYFSELPVYEELETRVHARYNEIRNTRDET